MPKTVKELLERRETCIRCGAYAEPVAWCKVRGERCGMVEDERRGGLVALIVGALVEGAQEIQHQRRRRGCAALRPGASCACGYLHAYEEEKKP